MVCFGSHSKINLIVGRSEDNFIYLFFLISFEKMLKKLVGNQKI